MFDKMFGLGPPTAPAMPAFNSSIFATQLKVRDPPMTPCAVSASSFNWFMLPTEVDYHKILFLAVLAVAINTGIIRTCSWL